MLFHNLASGKTLLLCVCLFLRLVQAVQEIRVDDNDPTIQYIPAENWHLSAQDVLDQGGYHMVATTPTAEAVFRFKGVGIAFMAPKWADSVTTQVRLDGGVPELIDLVDHTRELETDGPSTVASSIVWQAMNLDYTDHTLVISVGPGERFAVIDMLVYYVPDDVTTTSTGTSTTTSSTSTRTSSPNNATVSSSTKTGLAIALGIVCSVFALLVLGGVFYFWRRRRQKRRERELWNQPTDNIPPPVMDEVDDGISAPPTRRYRSIPSLNALRAAKANSQYSTPSTLDSNLEQSSSTLQSRQVKQTQTSKLRNVVAQDGTHHQAYSPRSYTSSSTPTSSSPNQPTQLPRT